MQANNIMEPPLMDYEQVLQQVLMHRLVAEGAHRIRLRSSETHTDRLKSVTRLVRSLESMGTDTDL